MTVMDMETVDLEVKEAMKKKSGLQEGRVIIG